MLELGFPFVVSGTVRVTITGNTRVSDMGTTNGTFYSSGVDSNGHVVIYPNTQTYAFLLDPGGPTWPLTLAISTPGKILDSDFGRSLINATIGVTVDAASADSGGEFAVTAVVPAPKASSPQSLYLAYTNNAHFGSPYIMSIYTVTFAAATPLRAKSGTVGGYFT